MKAQSQAKSITSDCFAIVLIVSSLLLPGCSSRTNQQVKEPEDRNSTSTASNANVPAISPDVGVHGSGETDVGAPGKSLPVPSLGKMTNSTADESKSELPTKVGGTGQSAASPEKALAQARGLRRQASKAEQSKRYGEAFNLASQAWEAVQAFPDHEECQAMTGDLAAQLDQLSQAASPQTKAKAADSRKQLIEK